MGDLKEIEIIRPSDSALYKKYVDQYHTERQRQGASLSLSYELLKRHNYFASSMVKFGDADGMITGATQNYPECFKPIMRVFGHNQKYKSCGVIILIFKQRVIFLADCTVNINPDAKELSNIALSTAQLYQRIMLKEPKIAFLSFSNFGSSNDESARKVAKAAEMARKLKPDMQIDGEMQADVAVNQNILEKLFDFSELKGAADILVFPDLNSANISYKLLSQLANATPIWPYFGTCSARC